jgi:hypothetical protein
VGLWRNRRPTQACCEGRRSIRNRFPNPHPLTSSIGRPGGRTRNGDRFDPAASRVSVHSLAYSPRVGETKPSGVRGAPPSDAGPDGQVGRYPKPCQDSQFVNIHAGLVVKEIVRR